MPPQLVEGECKKTLLIVLDTVLSEEINLVSYLLHLLELGADVVLARLDGQILLFFLVGLVIDDQLGLHEFKRHNEEGQATHDLPPRAVICVDELALLGLKGVVDFPGDTILQYEMEGSTELLEADLVSIGKSKFSGLVWVDVINLRVRGICE